ncbi:unnamed protein product [Phytophthora fragariaefolia]|uniref:Unnamed protein product n=1 Tax=Phytophthora fragariaefolia TaxID=1490495 RepID=A0A9W6WT07_9STRA|nr:unnamed protein product [Phytophthora fragariaefolia]
MAAATTSDGTESTESNNLALSGFLSNAWRRPTDGLRLITCEDSQDPLYEMNRAIKRLCMVAKHQGLLPPRSKQLTSLGKRKNSDYDKPHDRATKTGKRNSSSKRGKLPRRDYSNARCGECGEYGHTTGYHNTFVIRSKGAAHAASSVAAKSSSVLPKSDSEDDKKITSAESEESA